MLAPVLLASDFESIGFAVAVAAVSLSIAAYYIAAEWRKSREAKIEADLKREMVQKGLSADEIERILKATTPPKP